MRKVPPTKDRKLRIKLEMQTHQKLQRENNFGGINSISGEGNTIRKCPFHIRLRVGGFSVTAKLRPSDYSMRFSPLGRFSHKIGSVSPDGDNRSVRRNKTKQNKRKRDRTRRSIDLRSFSASLFSWPQDAIPSDNFLLVVGGSSHELQNNQISHNNFLFLFGGDGSPPILESKVAEYTADESDTLRRGSILRHAEEKPVLYTTLFRGEGSESNNLWRDSNQIKRNLDVHDIGLKRSKSVSRDWTGPKQKCTSRI